MFKKTALFSRDGFPNQVLIYQDGEKHDQDKEFHDHDHLNSSMKIKIQLATKSLITDPELLSHHYDHDQVIFTHS